MVFSSSIAARAAANAESRCGAAAATITAMSPIARSPTRWCIAPGHRWNQRELVAVGERLVDADVLAVAGDHDLTSLGDQRVLFRDASDRVAHGRARRKLQIEVSSARRLTIRGEQTNEHAHGMSLAEVRESHAHGHECAHRFWPHRASRSGERVLRGGRVRVRPYQEDAAR